MHAKLGFLVGAIALVLAACGDEGKGGGAPAPVGSWTIDREKTVESGIAVAKKAGVGAKLTDAQIREQVEKNVTEGTFRADFGADKTVTVETKGMGTDAVGKGTWSRDGDRVVITLATKNGAPAEGEDRQPATFVVRGDRLVVLAPDGAEIFWLKRR